MDTQQQQAAGLSWILHADRNQVAALKTIAESQGQTSIDLARAAEFLKVPQVYQLSKLINYNPDREQKIRQFLFTLTHAEMEWIEAVRQTTWDAFNWPSEASQLFLQAESLGISETVSLAVIAAHMTVKQFPVPADLNIRLFGAKLNAQKQRDDLAAAERRRAEALKNQEDQK